MAILIVSLLLLQVVGFLRPGAAFIGRFGAPGGRGERDADICNCDAREWVKTIRRGC